MTFYATDTRATYQCVETAVDVYGWLSPVQVSQDVFAVYESQRTWYIAAVTGNDSNTGASQASAIKTIEEFIRRVPNPRDAGYIVWLLEDDPSDHTIIINGSRSVQIPTYVQFQGIAKPPLISGTVAATQAVDPVTKKETTITDPAVASWAPYLNRVIEFSGGGRAVVMRNLGGNTAALSQPQLWPFNGTPVVVAPGETYSVLDFVTMSGLIVTAGECEIDFQDLRFSLPNHSFECDGLTFAESCIYDGADSDMGGFFQLYGCATVTNTRAEGTATIDAIGGCALSYISRNGGNVFVGNTTAVNYQVNSGGIMLSDIGGGYVAALNGGATNAAIVDPGGHFVLSNGGVVPFWGKGYTGVGVDIRGGAVMAYSPGAVPSISTTGDEVHVGGVVKTFAGIDLTGGFIEPNNGAMVVPR